MRTVNPNALHNQSIAIPMSGYASSGITTLRGIDRLESISAILPIPRDRPQRSRTSTSRSLNKGRVPRTPGFPVKFVGVDELHAASPNESRTRGRCLVLRTENPGISLVFCEIWDTTDVDC